MVAKNIFGANFAKDREVSDKEHDTEKDSIFP